MAIPAAAKKVAGTAAVAIIAVGIVALITQKMAKSTNPTVAKIGNASPI